VEDCNRGLLRALGAKDRKDIALAAAENTKAAGGKLRAAGGHRKKPILR